MRARSGEGSRSVHVAREATTDDLPGLLGLYRQLHCGDPDLSDAVAAATFARILGNPALHVLVLEEDGALLATAYLNVIPNLTRAAAPYAVIENVVVDEARRGMGLGKALMAEVLERAWAEGCYKAMLQTGSRHQSVHAFYRAAGFTDDDKVSYVARPASMC